MTELCYDYKNVPGSPGCGDIFIKILRTEYDDLKSTTGRYNNLCQNLIHGGVDKNTLDLLSRHSAKPSYEEQGVRSSNSNATFPPHDSPVQRRAASLRRTNSSESFTYTGGGDRTDGTDGSNSDTCQESTHTPKEQYTEQYSVFGELTGENVGNQPPNHLQYQRNATRTITFDNLAAGTTLADVTAVVRGGRLVDVYWNNRDNTASVSFALEKEARLFYDHAQHHGLCINDTRVTVSWNERQFVLPSFVVTKLCSGASRNIVIRRCARNITTDTVTRDLDHIHNLSVVKIEFVGNDCYVGTNSIISASFARTCLMSQLKYKSCRIEWAPDECAQSLDRMPQKAHRQPTRKLPTWPRKKGVACVNRFKLLDVDN